jgi:tetratricopeptide (TPR) repeat protein
MELYLKESNFDLSECKNGIPDGFYELAQDEAESEELDEAIKLMDFVMEKWPSYAKAYELKGTFLIEKGAQEDGISLLKRSIEIDPTLVEAYSELGQAYYNFEDYDAAIEQWEKELEYTPYDKFAYFMIADAYRKAGKIGSSIDILKRFISEDKKSVLARYELMDLYNQLEDYETSSEYEKEILKMVPYYPGDIEPWAKVLFKNRKYTEVIKIVEEHIQKYPIDSHFKLLLVVPYAKLERYDEARKILEEFKGQKDWYFYGKKELFETNLDKKELDLCGIS